MQPSYRLALGKREKLGRGTFVLGSRLKFTNGTELQELGYKCFILIQRVSQALNISGIRDEIESKNNSGRESGLSLAACGYAFSVQWRALVARQCPKLEFDYLGIHVKSGL